MKKSDLLEELMRNGKMNRTASERYVSLVEQNRMIEAGFEKALMGRAPVGADNVQVEMVRAAFFSGARFMFNSLTDDDLPKPHQAYIKVAFAEEITAYFKAALARAKAMKPDRSPP